MAYIKTTWTNRRPPAINATNLNHIEEGIYNAHEAIAAVQNFKYTSVDTLPTASEETMGIIYLVPKPGSEISKNEWITIANNDSTYSWLLIGTTSVDLDNYYTKDVVDNLLTTKQAVLVSGSNIKTINGNDITGGGNVEIETGSGKAHILED